MKQGIAKILLVVDGTEQMNLLTDALTSAGHVVRTATSSQEALSVIEKEPPDIVLVDICLPDFRHGAFYKTLKKRYPELPIIVITGPTETAIGEDAGTNGLIMKPFRISHVEELIHNLLDEKSERDAIVTENTVLVVDDDEIFRTVLIRSLQLSGYKAMGAADGKMAIDILEDENIGTVIADINMPHIDGIELMKRIRRQWPEIPVVLISGYFSPDESLADETDQPDGFLMKPFNIQRIDELLKSLTQKKLQK